MAIIGLIFSHVFLGIVPVGIGVIFVIIAISIMFGNKNTTKNR